LQTRRLFNRAKKTGEWDTYKEAPTHYNKEIRKAKRSSCQETEDVAGGGQTYKDYSKTGGS
jgi:hypothetical protein